MPLKNGYVLVKTQVTDFLITKEEPISLSSPSLLEFGKSIVFEEYLLTFSEPHVVSNVDTIIWSDADSGIRHRHEGDRIDLGTHHKKIRRLFIDNKISEKDRQKAIIGEQDGQIIFLYVAGVSI